MAFFDTKYCTLCGKKIGFFSTIKIKDGKGICANCFSIFDIDVETAQYHNIESLNKLLELRKEDYKTFLNFNPTREIKVVAGFGTTYYFREDSKLKLWYFSKDEIATNPTLYRFDEIIDFEFLIRYILAIVVQRCICGF